MNKTFSWSFLFFSVLFLTSGSSKTNWFTGGENKFSLETVKNQPDYILPFKGKTSYAQLLIQVVRKDQSGRSSTKRQFSLIPTQGMISSGYILKDSPGRYEITVFGNNSGMNYTGICSYSYQAKKPIPEEWKEKSINEKILRFTGSMMGKKVGSGECWDLVQQALDENGADWQRPFQFGIPVEQNEVKPGDIVQMRNVKLEYENRYVYLGRPDHTAVIYEVLGPGHFKLAHQNVAGKRYVLIGEEDFSKAVSGSIRYYRPVAGIISLK